MISADLYDFLFGLWQQGLELWLDDEQLRFKGNQALLAGDNLNRLRDNKAEIIAYLEQNPLAFSGFVTNQGQRGIYLMQQLASGSSVYNQACLLQLADTINIEKLQQTVAQLVVRHEVLQSSFHQHNEQIVQRINPQLTINLEKLQSDLPIEQIYQQLADQPFKLQQGPLFKAILIQQAEQNYLLICAHHLIADFWAMQLLISDLQSLYTEQSLPELGQSFKEFSLQESLWLTGEQGQAAQAYWHDKLRPLPEPLNLPFDFNKPAKPSYQGKELSQTLSRELCGQLRQAAKAQQTTPFVWALSCFQYLLHRYSGADDICIGSPVANRLQRDSQQLAGHFANPLVLRQQFQQKQSFQDILQANKQQLLEAMRHQQYPIQRLIEELEPQQTLPFFQVAMAWSQLDSLALEPQFAQRLITMEQRGAIYPLVLSAYDNGETIQLSWRYDSDLYKAETIERYQQHLLNCLESTVTDATQSLADIDILTEQEKALYQTINQTDSEIPRNISVAALFERIAEKFPDHIAFRDVVANNNFSYQQLNQDANKIAQVLQQRGFASGDVIGLALGRCYANTAWLLACVKSGIIYIPIDPDNPDERIEAIRQTAQAKAIISQQKRDIQNILVLADLQAEIDQADDNWLVADNGYIDEDATACIFFTSGSTGTPKGVEIPHRAIVRLTHNTNFATYTENDRFCHICNTAFDASNVELWSSLLHGGCLLYLDNNQLLNPASFAEFVEQEKPTASVMTTALFNLFVQYKPDIFKDFRYLMFGGEAADQVTCNLCVRSGKPENLLNVYGPTENGTYSTVYLFEDEVQGSVPIGFVVSNSQAYIYDQYDQLAPIGVIGELIVGGDGVATAYRNQPELTAEQFFPDTYRNKGLLYRTGDLAWLREDGMVMYAGRADEQVKLRGFRIETKEVEQCLLNLVGIEQAYVDVNQQQSSLVAWLVANTPVDAQAIRQQLSQQLPNFMVPSAFVQLDALPLTANGKVDKQQLPQPTIEHIQSYLAPETELEKQLVTIWQQQFQLETIGTLDNFFDLGGHSLMAAKIVSNIEEQLGLMVEMRDIFEFATIQSLAANIQTGKTNNLPAITSNQSNEETPASLNQQRLWFLQQLNPESSAYNMPLALRIHKPLPASQIEQAINTLIRRHDALHSVFIDHQGEALLLAKPGCGIELEVINLDDQAAKTIETAISPYLEQLSQSIFDLRTAPIMKAQLLQLKEQQVLLLCLHHIAIDGVSANILLEELAALLNGQSLAATDISYADFSRWQHRAQSEAAWQQQIAYWQQELQGVTPLLNLPTDKPRPAVFHGDAEKFALIIDKDLAQQLEALAKQQQVSLFMLFMAAYAILLQRYSQQDDVCIGFPIAGRNQTATQNLVGLFVNNLVVKTDFHQTLSINDLLEQIKNKTLAAFANQDVPFDQIIDALNIERSLSYTPYLHVSFAFEELNIHERIEQALGNNFQLIPATKQAAKYDLNLSCFKQANGEVYAEFEYNQTLYYPETIERLAQRFQTILRALLTDTQQRCSKIKLLSPQEEQQIIAKQAPPVNSASMHIIEQFEAVAEQYPQHTAIRFESESVSYQQLNQQANQLARCLQQKGVQTNDFVGLYFDRSIDMLVSLLAVVKAGAAYIPLDPHAPDERNRFIIDDAKISLVISHQQVDQPENSQFLQFEQLIEQAKNLAKDNLVIERSLTENAYVIYTSGTTGNPKGCVISHGNVSRLFSCNHEQFQFSQNDCWTLFHSYAFDFSVWEIWGAWLFGGKLVVVPYWQSRDTASFYQLLVDEKVTVLNQTPSAFSQLISVDAEKQQDLSLRYIVFGGEALDFSALKVWQQRHSLEQTQLINMYGITETTVHVTYHEVSEQDLEHGGSIIGKPLNDLMVYLLDSEQQLTPSDMIGEMYVSGPGVSQGYLYQETLTQERFIANPFVHLLAKEIQAEHQVLYRSGDLAKRLSNGNLEYLGRADQQVNIRGHRIELGEIEATLNDLGDVQESMVLAPDNTQLIAYILSHKALDKQLLRQQLRQQLPDYMTPADFITVSEWPLTANGKIDKSALPQPNFSSTTEYMAPSNDTEEKLCQIWQDILEVEQVGIQDNFFELGGHSLLATKLAARIRSELQCELALQQIFEYPTIEELALVILEQGIQDLDISEEELLALLGELEE